MFSTLENALIVKTITHNAFLTLKGYSAICVFLSHQDFKSVQYIRQFTSLDFFIILSWFRCLPDG